MYLILIFTRKTPNQNYTAELCIKSDTVYRINSALPSDTFHHSFRSFYMKMIKYFGAIILLVILLHSCAKDSEQATNSIEGDWEVTQIISTYGEFAGGSFSGEETITEDGLLGEFTFGESTVDYQFTRNDTLFSGTAAWNLTSERVNEGFIKVTKFKLEIEDHYLFDCVFGDETKNSEKDATQMTLMQYPEEDGYGVFIQLELEKKI